MFLCICNAIDEKMIEENPELIKKIGTNCGRCLENAEVAAQAEALNLKTNLKENNL